MKFLFDFFPILAFFVAFKVHDDPKQGILVATAVAIAASLVQVGAYWYKHRRFETMHLVTLLLILLLGGATLWLQDEIFIKWKPTAVNWLFGIVFLGSHYIGQKPLIERMLGSSLTLPRGVWTRLNMSWVIFFIFMGFANLYVAYNFDTDTWVDFKLFGMMGMTLAFVVGQAFYLGRYIKDDVEEES
jgi:intracellular septation protein